MKVFDFETSNSEDKSCSGIKETSNKFEISLVNRMKYNILQKSIPKEAGEKKNTLQNIEGQNIENYNNNKKKKIVDNSKDEVLSEKIRVVHDIEKQKNSDSPIKYQYQSYKLLNEKNDFNKINNNNNNNISKDKDNNTDAKNNENIKNKKNSKNKNKIDENSNDIINKDEEDTNKDSILCDKFPFYGIDNKSKLKYIIPNKFGNPQINRNNIGQNNEVLTDLFSDSSTDNKNVMVSELDIQLSNSQSFYFNKNSTNNTENKPSEYNIDTYKKIEKDFKKEIEKNIKRFLKKNREDKNKYLTNNSNADIKDKKMSNVKKKSLYIKINKAGKNKKMINHCVTDMNNKELGENSSKIQSFIEINNKNLSVQTKNINFSVKKVSNNSTEKNIIKKEGGSPKIKCINKTYTDYKANTTTNKNRTDIIGQNIPIYNENAFNKKNNNLVYEKMKKINASNFYDPNKKKYCYNYKNEGLFKLKKYLNEQKKHKMQNKQSETQRLERNPIEHINNNNLIHSNTPNDSFNKNNEYKKINVINSIGNNNNHKSNNRIFNDQYHNNNTTRKSLKFPKKDKKSNINSNSNNYTNNPNTSSNNNIIMIINSSNKNVLSNNRNKNNKIFNNNSKINININNNEIVTNTCDINNININLNNYNNTDSINNNGKNEIISGKNISIINNINFNHLINNKNNCINFKFNTKKSLNNQNNKCNNTIEGFSNFNQAKTLEINNSKIFIKNDKFHNEVFQRLHNKKKLSCKEPSNIKNKILNYYNNKKTEIVITPSDNNLFQKKQALINSNEILKNKLINNKKIKKKIGKNIEYIDIKKNNPNKNQDSSTMSQKFKDSTNCFHHVSKNKTAFLEVKYNNVK